MDNPFLKVTILPSYISGFTFIWEISQSYHEQLPWTFTVEEGPSSEGPWIVISPPLVNIFSWFDGKRRVVGKDPVLFFRVKLVTAEGIHYSAIKTPYGDLDRREYLLVKDIMRREVLQQRTLAGVLAKLWIKATWGAKCTNCIDPITGDVISSNCALCMGTGRLPPYHGPYDVWATFTPTQRNLELKPDGTGLHQPYTWMIRMVGFPYAKDYDIVVDTASDKRYIVDGVNNELEIRRVPVIQVLHANELPVSDPAYRLGTTEEEKGCVIPLQ